MFDAVDIAYGGALAGVLLLVVFILVQLVHKLEPPKQFKAVGGTPMMGYVWLPGKSKDEGGHGRLKRWMKTDDRYLRIYPSAVLEPEGAYSLALSLSHIDNVQQQQREKFSLEYEGNTLSFYAGSVGDSNRWVKGLMERTRRIPFVQPARRVVEREGEDLKLDKSDTFHSSSAYQENECAQDGELSPKWNLKESLLEQRLPFLTKDSKKDEGKGGKQKAEDQKVADSSSPLAVLYRPNHALAGQLRTQGQQALKHLRTFAASHDGWTLKKSTQGIEVYQKQEKLDNRPVFKSVHEVQIEPCLLFKHILYNNATAHEWRDSVLAYNSLLRVDEHTDVTHTICKAVGPISGRDFVNSRFWHQYENGDIAFGGSCLDYKDAPKSKGVRGENGPSGYVIHRLTSSSSCDLDAASSRVTYVVSTDLKGWFPKRVIELTLAGVMRDSSIALEKRVDYINPQDCVLTGCVIHSRQHKQEAKKAR